MMSSARMQPMANMSIGGPYLLARSSTSGARYLKWQNAFNTSALYTKRKTHVHLRPVPPGAQQHLRGAIPEVAECTYDWLSRR